MLVGECEPAHVEFVEYTGAWPNLCTGILTLKIDGEECEFVPWGEDNVTTFQSFWSSGGECRNFETYKGEWIINVSDIPDRFKLYAAEIDLVFNRNVPYGCCGGCL